MAMTNKHNKAFGRVLNSLRVERKLSQEALGFDSGLTRAYISLLERGLNSPTLDTIYSIAEAIDLPASVIFTLLTEELADEN